MEKDALIQSENFLERLNEGIIIETGQAARVLNEELEAGKNIGLLLLLLLLLLLSLLSLFLRIS